MRLLALIPALFALQACTGESSLPSPTGEGTFRAVNAIPASPGIGFLIEERQIENVQFRNASPSQRFDDFEYDFNFEISILGESQRRRIATVTQKIDADRDYTFVLTGDVLSPTVSVWEADERTFDESETVFDVRFAHVAESLGTVDVYLDPPGTAPVLGGKRGTLSFGDVLDAIEFEEGDYVLTYTAPDDPNTLLYQTGEVAYAARNSQIIPIFDGNELDTSPYNVRRISLQSGVAFLPDTLTTPTVRIFQASISLPPSDVYDDEMLTNLVLPDHRFGDITGDIPIPVGATSYTYTAVGNPGAIQFEGDIDAVAGTRSNLIVIGDGDTRSAVTYVRDRQSISTQVRLNLYHAALNSNLLDLYVVESGTSIDDVNRTLDLVYSLITPVLSFEAGSYDIYAAVQGEKTVVAGPLSIDAVLGDSFELLLLDTVDPNVAEIRLIPPP